MVIGALIGKEKLFHYPDCQYAKKIKPDNTLYFENKDEARDLGYKHCPHCSRLIKYYNEKKKEIDRFLLRNNMSMYIEDDSMYIDNITSAWKITVESEGPALVLYHANTENYSKLEKVNGKIIHHYHLQKYKDTRNILTMLEYIIDHDEWKMKHSKDYENLSRCNKKQKKNYNKAKRNAKKRDIKTVYNLIEKVSCERKNKENKE